MKKLWILILALGLVFSITACSEEEKTKGENKESKERKTTYVVGFDNTFAPMGFEKDGENMGFDIDLAKKIQEKMGLTFEFQSIDWTLKETELESKNIDMIWNGYSITDERKEKILFSEPYMDNRILIIVDKDSDIKDKEDLKDKIISTQDQSSALDALNRDEIAKEVSDIITYASYNDVFNDLKNKRCDAVAVDETLGLYYLKTAGDLDKYRILEEDLGREKYAVGFRKEETELVEKFNAALKELKEEGEVEKIYQKWFE